MASRKILTVFGATGAQGGAVAKMFLNDAKLKTEWAVRAVTRDVTKDSAKKLSDAGAELVTADVNDKASLKKAMAGAYAVYAVTNYWEKADDKLEIQQGKNMADAAKEDGVQHYIWSSLLDINKLSGGELSKVYHFDSKAAVEQYIRDIGLPATFFMPGFYMSNLSGSMFKQSPPNNEWTLGLPISSKSIFPLYESADTGKYVKAALVNREKLLGERILGATNYMTGQEIVDAFRKTFPVDGKNAVFYQVPEEGFRGFMKSVGTVDYVIDEMYENMKLLDTFGYYGGASLEPTHKYVEEPLTTWEEHMKAASAYKDLK